MQAFKNENRLLPGQKVLCRSRDSPVTEEAVLEGVLQWKPGVLQWKKRCTSAEKGVPQRKKVYLSGRKGVLQWKKFGVKDIAFYGLQFL
jgi:hypothetical protein